jgi:two-component system, NarL family, sensor kinase
LNHLNANTDELIFIACLAMLVLLMLCLFFIFFFIRFKEKQTAFIKSKILLQNEYENALLNAQIEIQEQTLLAVSQEIHDNIGQTLTVAKLYLNNEGTIANKDQPNVKDLISKAISDLRQLSKTLNSDRIKDIGFLEAFRFDLDIIEQSGQIGITIEMLGDHYRMNSKIELILYRVCQEILSNILKHANAKNIHIVLSYEREQLKMLIADDGKGFDVERVLKISDAEQGVGLQNIIKRIKIMNGYIAIESSPGSGTQHTIKIFQTQKL